jgi:carbonic anhydrase
MYAAVLCAWSLMSGAALANDPPAEKQFDKVELLTKRKVSGEVTTSSAANPKEVGNQVREALGTSVAPNKKLTVVVSDKSPAGHAAEPAAPQSSRAYAQARAVALGHAAAPAPSAKAGDAHGGEVHWDYEGENGPQAWGRLKPAFNVCAIGKRQSPINIVDGNTLQGPAEPVQFNYTPSDASVVNNGHTIQVDVQGDNGIVVRGSNYRLVQFHFHTPSEEQINYKRSPMVAHLVHKNDEGQLAVVAILLELGKSNELIDKVWTYMPLDAGDRVRMPAGILNMNELLPIDQRYYQFIGSLTTPPCTEGVLWMVMKQPIQISKAQYRLFTQLYPNNARPVQALNGRPVRDAQ